MFRLKNTILNVSHECFVVIKKFYKPFQNFPLQSRTFHNQVLLLSFLSHLFLIFQSFSHSSIISFHFFSFLHLFFLSSFSTNFHYLFLKISSFFSLHSFHLFFSFFNSTLFHFFLFFHLFPMILPFETFYSQLAFGPHTPPSRKKTNYLKANHPLGTTTNNLINYNIPQIFQELKNSFSLFILIKFKIKFETLKFKIFSFCGFVGLFIFSNLD